MLFKNVPEDKEEVKRKLYVGATRMYVEAINPTLDDLAEMGIQAKSDPTYKTDKNFRLDFWLRKDIPRPDEQEPEIVRVKYSIWVSLQKAEPSKTGKIKVINQRGQTAYLDADHVKAKTVPEGKEGKEYWFQGPYQESREGQNELREFVNAWTNQTKKAELVTYDFKDICNGVLKSLYEIGAGSRAGHVKVVLGVQSSEKGRYQVTSSRVYYKWETEENIHKDIVTAILNVNNKVDFGFMPNGEFHTAYYLLRPWADSPSVPTTLPPPKLSLGPNSVAEPIGGEDDLPF